MTALTARQSLKVKAALSLIAIHGHNPRPVQKQAQASIAKGTPAHTAYKNALEGFIDRNPALGTTLTVAVDLIHHSDDATAAIYDRALTAYNDSGDASHLDDLAPMILEDAKALAIHNGEVSEADAASWDIGDALGYSDEAFAEMPDVPDANSPAPGETVQSQFEFTGLPISRQPAEQTPAPPPAPAGGWGEQGYSSGSIWSSARNGSMVPQPAAYDPTKPYQDETGYRVAMTGEAARRWHGTPVGATPYLRDATGIRAVPTGEQARREAGVPLGPNA